jgi:hypothetical protein
MNINAISTASLESVQASGSIAGTKVNPNPASTAEPQTDTLSISAVASFLSNLQQTQQADPSLFQKVTTFIASRLQHAAQNADSKGNTAVSDQLNQLATQFQNGQIPTAATLQQEGLLGHGNEHNRHVWIEVNRVMKDAINDAGSQDQPTTNRTSPTETNQ